MNRSVPGVEPRVVGPRGAAFCSIFEFSSSSISFDDDAVSPVICTSFVLPAVLMSSCCSHVVSGSRREISST